MKTPKRNERLYSDLEPAELLAQGAEPALIVRAREGRAGWRIPLYAGEDLDAALARARSAVPEAAEIELQVYLEGRFHYARL